MRGAVGSPLSLHAQSNTKMHSKVCNTIQKSTWKHFGWAFWLLPSQRKLPQIGSFFNWWKCHFDHWKGCQNMPKWLKPITSHTPTLKLECLSYIMLPCHTCHDEKKPRSIVFLKNSLRETPCSCMQRLYKPLCLSIGPSVRNPFTFQPLWPCLRSSKSLFRSIKLFLKSLKPISNEFS